MKKWIYGITKVCRNEIRRVSALALAIVLLFFSIPVSQSESRALSDKHVALGSGKLVDVSSAGEQDVTGAADAGQDTEEQYKVTYNKNAPTGAAVTGVVEDVASPYQKNSEVTVLANGVTGDSRNKGFNCNGYSFESWNTKADGSGTTYRPGDTFTITEDVVLYAQWQVMITINGFDISPSRITIPQGSNYSFTVVVRGTGNLTKEATWEVVGQNMSGTKSLEIGSSLRRHEDRWCMVVVSSCREMLG